MDRPTFSSGRTFQRRTGRRGVTILGFGIAITVGIAAAAIALLRGPSAHGVPEPHSAATARDTSDWNALEQLFSNPVYSDRTSLFGGEPQTNTPAELVGGLQYVLGKLDTTHHLISSQVIDLNGDEATSAANMQGTHVLANASGGSQWVVAGRHDYQPKRTAEGWRIAGITFTLQWASGNEHILTLATA